MPIFEKNISALEKIDKNRVLHIKGHFYVHNTQSLTHFSSAPHRNIFSEIGMRVMSKNIPNLQVYEHPPATPTTLSIKVVIVVLY